MSIYLELKYQIGGSKDEYFFRELKYHISYGDGYNDKKLNGRTENPVTLCLHEVINHISTGLLYRIPFYLHLVLKTT